MTTSRIRQWTISRLRHSPKGSKIMSKQSNSVLLKLYRRVKSEIVEKFKKDLGDREAMRR